VTCCFSGEIPYVEEITAVFVPDEYDNVDFHKFPSLDVVCCTPDNYERVFDMNMPKGVKVRIVERMQHRWPYSHTPFCLVIHQMSALGSPSPACWVAHQPLRKCRVYTSCTQVIRRGPLKPNLGGQIP
jgi:hypothetical protein